MGYIGTKPSVVTSLPDNIVTADKIVSGAVTNAKINDVAASKLTGQVADANAPSGSILQVVNTVLTSATSVNTSGGFAEITGLATSITPISSSSKILVFLTLSGGNANGYRTGIKLVRNSTDIFVGDSAGSRTRATLFAKNLDSSNQASFDFAFSGLDSPATASAITYKVYASVENSTTFYVNTTLTDSDLSSHYRAASSLLLMEVAA